MCRRTLSGPASHCVRSPDNQAQQDDNDRKAAQIKARTSATRKVGHAAVKVSGHLSAQLLCRKWRGRLPVSSGRKSGVPSHVPPRIGPATGTTRTAQRRRTTYENIGAWDYPVLPMAGLWARNARSAIQPSETVGHVRAPVPQCQICQALCITWVAAFSNTKVL